VKREEKKKELESAIEKKGAFYVIEPRRKRLILTRSGQAILFSGERGDGTKRWEKEEPTHRASLRGKKANFFLEFEDIRRKGGVYLFQS